ncbi:RNA ligase [Rhodococcus erythropolis]|uniref:Putative RNA ligase n=1 Tax=Rhodococcus erythropolis (strain PR4 / NBRC 100887) TaxID=234621 RepID=C0ZXW9_RHOE4|nr:RNA ligase [Rhodococcus erythropolis]BAH33204.1 putative RNA ligase [Rhodococcus erythropolis PR4]
MENRYNTAPQKQKLDEYVKIGLLRSQTNSAGTLTIYVYTETTQFDRLWNSVTRQARGLVLDNKSRCIIKCLPKFFNDNEPEALLEKPRDLDPTQLVVQDKVDGSLIQVANDPEYGLVVTSKGSFASDQAMWAREIIDEQYPPSGGYFEPGLTYIFELIHPDNRIVIDYGDRRELILLAVVENDTGKERDIYSKRFLSFDRVAKLDPSTVDNVEALNDKGLSEGVVVNFGGYRVKIKTAEYLRLHRIVTDFTPKRVWEALSNGDPLDFENMPEEFQTWLDETTARFNDEFLALDVAVCDEFERSHHLSDKELGLSTEFKYKGLVFMLRNGKDIGPTIWKQIKPRKEVVHAKTIDA